MKHKRLSLDLRQGIYGTVVTALDQTPRFEYLPVYPDVSEIPKPYQDAVKAQCIADYRDAVQLMETAIGDVALRYVFQKGDPETRAPGPLLTLAREVSKRYLDLINAYIATSMDLNIPMVPVDAGQLKNFGFDDIDILKLQPCALQFEAMIHLLQRDQLDIDTLLLKLANAESRNALYNHPNLSMFINDYVQLENREALDRLIFLLTRFGRKSPEEILTRISQIAHMKPKVTITESEAGKLHASGTARTFLQLLDFLKFPAEQAGAFLTQLSTAEGRQALAKNRHNQHLLTIITQYETLPHRDILDAKFQSMAEFGFSNPAGILAEIKHVSNGHFSHLAGFEERLQMEVRHRIAGDGSEFCGDPGNIGSNPLAYLNMLKNGEGTNLEAEFRERMYVVYRLNNFANSVIRNYYTISHINRHLQVQQAGWQLDPYFIQFLKNRDAALRGHIPPIFRYAQNADLNSHFRHYRTPAAQKTGPNPAEPPTLSQLLTRTAPLDSPHRIQISNREIFAQTGEPPVSFNPAKHDGPVQLWTGDAGFELDDCDTVTDSRAQAYLEMVKNTHSPQLAGISGTTDQTIRMSNLVGIGSHNSPEDQQILLDIRLAMLAFMLPHRDHSVIEIMQSAKSFGLPFQAGPGYHHYIYPSDPAFSDHLKAAMALRNRFLPDYYLSSAHAQNCLTALDAAPVTPFPEAAAPTTDALRVNSFSISKQNDILLI